MMYFTCSGVVAHPLPQTWLILEKKRTALPIRNVRTFSSLGAPRNTSDSAAARGSSQRNALWRMEDDHSRVGIILALNQGRQKPWFHPYVSPLRIIKIKTTGVNITTIAYLKVLIIEMGSTILLMVVFQSRESIGTICGGERSRKCISLTKLFNLALPPIILGSVEKIGLISNGNPYLSPISSHFSSFFVIGETINE